MKVHLIYSKQKTVYFYPLPSSSTHLQAQNKAHFPTLPRILPRAFVSKMNKYGEKGISLS